MRLLRRLFPLLVLTAVLVAAVQLYGPPPRWLALGVADLARPGDNRPAATVSPEDLPDYTRRVANEDWFQQYFTRLAFSDEEGPTIRTGRLTKWDKRRIRIALVNDGGPGMRAYVKQLVAQLNGIQSATRFSLVDGRADITIEFLSHDEYRAQVGDDSVGNCATRFFRSSPGIVEATIRVNAEAVPSPRQRQPVVIHELTHALGFKGHFHHRGFRDRSVLYFAAYRATWSREDEACIRIMYSASMQNGMTLAEAKRALRSIPA